MGHDRRIKQQGLSGERPLVKNRGPLARIIGGLLSEQVSWANIRPSRGESLREAYSATPYGPARTAMDIIKCSFFLPSSRPTDLALEGTSAVYPGGARARRWSASFRGAQVSQDRADLGSQELVARLGVLRFSATAVPPRGLELPVDSLTLSAESDYDESGNLGPAQVTLRANSKPDLSRQGARNRVVHGSQAGVELAMDSSGAVTQCTLTRVDTGQTTTIGASDEPAILNLGPFLDSVHINAEVTARVKGNNAPAVVSN